MPRNPNEAPVGGSSSSSGEQQQQQPTQPTDIAVATAAAADSTVKSDAQATQVSASSMG
jgi:hypothetical protein